MSLDTAEVIEFMCDWDIFKAFWACFGVLGHFQVIGQKQPGEKMDDVLKNMDHFLYL